MKKVFGVVFISLSFAAFFFAQTKQVAKPTPSKIPSSVPVKPGTTARTIATKPKVDPGTVSGRTYNNEQFGFDVTFPDTWLIPDKDFEDVMKMNGFNLHIADSVLLTPATAKQFEKHVTILLTAYRSMPGTIENGVVIIAVEDLSSNPKIKDAVDYFDAMRTQFKTMKLPDDFKYSETQAEKLGDRYFAFLDTSAPTGKKRMYARVRNGFAILFTISYAKPEDLKVLKQVLEAGHFSIK